MRALLPALLPTAALRTAAGHDAAIRTGAAGISCGYAVDQQPVAVSGTVPGYLNGSYYHAVSDTGLSKDLDSKGIGGVIAVHFAPGRAPTASFGAARGTGWHLHCPLGGGMPPRTYASDCAITLNGVTGNGSVAVVCAMPAGELTALDGRSLATAEAPAAFGGDALGPAQTAYPPVLGPSYFSAGHMVTDAGGDTYGLVYVFTPAPAYRVYKVPAGTRRRVIVADVAPHPQFGGRGPAYIHQALALTPSFLIIPEIPMLMPNGTFDWGQVQDGWLPDGKLIFRVLDKRTGEELATYEAPRCYSWHAINAWENETHITYDLSWQPTEHALDIFTNRSHGNRPGWWNGTLARATMPNPRHPASPTTGAAVVAPLTAPPALSPEFAVINPAHMWRRETRWAWALATTVEHHDDEGYPNLLKLDMATGAQRVWSPPGYRGMPLGLAAPMFVPAAADQPPESDAGAVLVLAVEAGGAPVLYIVDGAAHTQLARLDLPIAPMPSIGLHNHFSSLPSSV